MGLKYKLNINWKGGSLAGSESWLRACQGLQVLIEY